MKIVYKKVDELIPYINNSRTHSEEQVNQICASINEFGFTNPILIDEKDNIIAGHGRLLASKKLKMEEVPCIILQGLTETQKKAYIIADNKMALNAGWDEELLKLESENLKELDFDLELTGFDIDELDDLFKIEDDKKYELNQKGVLMQKFIIPPFSIFDTRKKEWKDRKIKWLNLGIKSGIGRNENLLHYSNICNKKNLTGTSIFDPVLCEICYKWFNIPSGNIYDPFSGGSVRGIVAQMLGYNYTGIDLSQKQIEANKEQAKKIGIEPKWINDDSLNVDKYIEDNSIDMIFSCPPYAFLEKYSDDPRDLSNMSYENFKKSYFEIIKKSCNKLKEDRFAIFVVGEVRDKKGAYINFVDDTKKAFIENGLIFYNEIILINSIGSSMLRCGKIFNGGRKVTKIHQNVLVFYKGDIKKIKENYKDIINEDEIVIEDDD